jgi:23S rRNA pseudouridine955/2504/2580 synthase
MARENPGGRPTGGRGESGRQNARYGHNYKRMNELSKDAVSWLTVGEDAAGQRVDNYLGKVLKGVPKSHIYRILRSGEVRVNKGRVGPDARLSLGDVVRVPPVRVATPAVPRTGDARPLRAGPKLPILFEDEALIALDKPSGLAVHGGSGIAQGLIEQLRAARPDAKYLELVHRLDRETSGILLIAKKRAALVGLHEQLREGAFDKRYLVLVRGRWRDEKRRVRLSLHKFATQDGERRVRVEDEGQEAETIFHRRRIWSERDPPLALLEAELKTGRTHQIRVHLTHLGFPLAGDDKYGDFAWNKLLAKQGLKRMFLHSHTLGITHPLSQEPMAFTSPLPADLARFVATLDAAETAVASTDA